jgi:hypothetical protein
VRTLFYRHQLSQRSKPSIADSAHYDQVFDAAKRAEPFTMLDDAFGQSFSDAGQSFQFVRRGSIDIDWSLIGY